MLSPGARTYILNGLEMTPIVATTLLKDFGTGAAIWDIRLAPERFTLRESLAHLADWDGVWTDRVRRILELEDPIFPDIDEGQIAIDRHYESSDPQESLRRFQADRANLVALLRAQPEEAWARMGTRGGFTPMTLEEFLGLILGHDSYHLRQVAETVNLA
jgi:hypothetical protein